MQQLTELKFRGYESSHIWEGIREIQIQDIPHIKNILGYWHGTYLKKEYGFTRYDLVEEYIQYIFNSIQSPRNPSSLKMYVYEKNGKAVGCFGFKRTIDLSNNIPLQKFCLANKYKGNLVQLHLLFVHPAFRRIKIATNLFNHVKLELVRQGFFYATYSSNDFWEKNGWKFHSDRRDVTYLEMYKNPQSATVKNIYAVSLNQHAI